MPKVTTEKAKKVGVAVKAVIKKPVALKEPNIEESVVVEAPIVEAPLVAPKPKHLGYIGISKVVQVRPKIINGILYNEVLTGEGTTFLLSDEDLKKQFKAVE